jgi:hypothetical protein
MVHNRTKVFILGFLAIFGSRDLRLIDEVSWQSLPNLFFMRDMRLFLPEGPACGSSTTRAAAAALVLLTFLSVVSAGDYDSIEETTPAGEKGTPPGAVCALALGGGGEGVKE